MVSAPFATNNTVTKGTKLPESRTVIRKLSFAPRSRAALSLPIAVQFLRCRGRSLWFQRCDFRTAEQLFLLTTAAQNIHVFLPKLPLHKKHFFGWLKRAISSTACGTSTLKSPLLRAFFTPHVHSRLRKRLSRCTLDCGFKTLESPALRGFEVGPRALATAALYLVLLSNGLHRPKIRLKKFGFSLKTVPANIAKKLPPQRCFQPFLIPIFNFSHKRHTFAFAGESGYTTRLSAKDRTQRLTRRNRGLHSLVHSVVLCCRRYPFYSTTLLYTYISRFSVNPQHQQKRIIRQSCHHKFYPQPLFNFSYNRPTFAFTSESGHTLGSRRKIAHNGSHGETRGRFGWGRYYYPRSVPHVSETLRGRGLKRQTLPLLGLGRRRS